MLATGLLLVSLLASTPAPAAAAADPTVSYVNSLEGRHARLLEGVELAATYKPSELPPLRLLDGLRFSMQLDTPMGLDTGGGAGSDTRQLAALLLGLVVGFGTGHLVAQDRNGFLLFLLVDVAIIAVGTVLSVAIGHGVIWGLGSVGLLVSHIIQGLDAYAQAGGPRIVEVTRKRAVELSSLAGGTRETPWVTTRAFGFTF